MSHHPISRLYRVGHVGATGLRDEVNRHYWQVFGASAAIGAIAGLAQYGTTGGLGSTTFPEAYRQAAGSSLATSSSRVLDRYLNVPPAYRQERDGEGKTVDERLIEGLTAGRDALSGISEQLARDDVAALETQGRFIKSRYGEQPIEN